MSIREKIEQVLDGVPYEVAMTNLKKVETELIRKNGLSIMQLVSRFAQAHPKIKEPSNSYKKQ